MAMTLSVFGGFLIIQDNVGRLVKGWGEELQVFVYLEDGVDAAAAESMRAAVAAYPEVRVASYVSKERAWDEFKKTLGSQSGILDGLNPKVLPASLDLELRSAHRSREAVLRLARRLAALDGVQDVEYPETWLEKIRLLVIGIEWLKWVLGGFLFLVAFLIVGSTIKLAIVARQDEIEIMQLAGAADGLIKAPFVIEGMIQGVVGAALALGMLQASFALLTAELLAPFGRAAGWGTARFSGPRAVLLPGVDGMAVGHRRQPAVGEEIPGVTPGPEVEGAKSARWDVMNGLRVAIGVLAAISLCLPLHALRPAAAEKADEIADLKQRIRQERAALDGVRRGESSVLEVLEEIETTLQRKSRRLETLNSRLRQRERDVDKAELAADNASTGIRREPERPGGPGPRPLQVGAGGNSFRVAQR